MENKKEVTINNNDKHEIKLYEENRSIPTPPVLELLINKCPLRCNNCKTIYTNKLTGIQIRCQCHCHDRIILETH